MNDRIVLSKPSPNTLVVRHSITRAGLSLLIALAWMALWYGFVFSGLDQNLRRELDSLLRGEFGENWKILIFMAAPLLMVPNIVTLVRTCLVGRVYEFDGMTRTVTRNGKDVAVFDGIESVQIRTIRDSESADEYRLSLRLRDGSKVALAHMRDEEKAAQAADDIADILKVEVLKK